MGFTRPILPRKTLRPNDTVTGLRQDQNLFPNSFAGVPFLLGDHDPRGSFIVVENGGVGKEVSKPYHVRRPGWGRVAKRSEIQLSAPKDEGYYLKKNNRVRQFWL